MDIFNNDHEVLQLGGLSIENHLDGVLIVGDVQIDKNLAGKQQAQALYDFAKQLMARFEALGDEELQQESPQVQSAQFVANPFE